MKRMTLCADDYGQSPEISAGILKLLSMDRLQAVSCMTESPDWPAAARALRERPGEYETGLHFNLTHPFSQAGRSISSVMKEAWLRQMDPVEVARRFDSQWQTFVREMGSPPDYVDGHQHVHAFPVIRKVVAQRVKALSSNAWVRTPDGWGAAPKTLVLAWASRGLRRTLGAESLATNPGFAGLRPYEPGFDFRRAFWKWLTESPDGTLVMCHPGLPSQDVRDPIRDCRPLELAYLTSDDFADDCRASDVVFERPTFSGG